MTSSFISHRRPSDAGLNLLWPGLAQLNQRRVGAAVFFALEAAVACAVLLWNPALRSEVFIGVVGITAWSVLDAYLAER